MATASAASISTNRKVVFILSESRSGSTWLSYVLGSHSTAAHLGEYFRPFTYKNHTACRLCDAKGLAECEVLYGIEHIEQHFAHDFAFATVAKPILIDCSKNMEWMSHFLKQNHYNVKAIHLLRDPRGWFASERRRSPMTVEEGIQRWLKSNREIREFIETHSIPCATAFYDELAISPEMYFPRLCEEIGMKFEMPALSYWNFEHHGLGANGAAFNLIGKYENSAVTTGDDNFYKDHAGRPFFDDRWPTQINEAERTAIEQSTEIDEALNRLGRSFSHFDQLLESYVAKHDSQTDQSIVEIGENRSAAQQFDHSQRFNQSNDRLSKATMHGAFSRAMIVVADTEATVSYATADFAADEFQATTNQTTGQPTGQSTLRSSLSSEVKRLSDDINAIGNVWQQLEDRVYRQEAVGKVVNDSFAKRIDDTQGKISELNCRVDELCALLTASEERAAHGLCDSIQRIEALQAYLQVRGERLFNGAIAASSADLPANNNIKRETAVISTKLDALVAANETVVARLNDANIELSHLRAEVARCSFRGLLTSLYRKIGRIFHAN